MGWQEDAVVQTPSDWQKDEVVSAPRGTAAEIGVAALRGASQVGNMVRQGVTSLPPFAAVKPAVDLAANYINSKEQPSIAPTQPGSAANTFGELLGAGVASGGVGGPVKTLMQSVLPAAAGTVGEQIGGKPGEIIGAVTAPALTSVAANKVGQAIASRIQPRMQQFRQAGTEPSVGQATEFNFLQGFENLLSKFPGGQGIMRKFAENQQKDLGNTASTGVSAEDAGRSIEKGVSGFIGRTKQTWQQLDDAVAQKLGGASVQAPNTVKALNELTTPIPGAERSTAAPLDARVAQIKDSLSADLQQNGGVIPYEALRVIRSRVGAQLDDALVAGAKSGEMKKLYGALTDDLEAAAKAGGAEADFSRQNQFYKARMDRLENTLERVLGKTPEETFAKFMPKDANAVTTVRATMRSLDPEQRKVVTDAVVDRLGRANPGQQDVSGDVFSPRTFLTNWNKLSDGAKAQLFSDPAVRKNMDSLAAVTSNLESGARVFANPSGTAGAAAPLGIGYMIARGLTDLATGNVPSAVAHFGTAASATGGAMIGAKMLTSPKVVEWLAKAPTIAPEASAMYLGRLGVIFNETKDGELKKELGTFINSVSNGIPNVSGSVMNNPNPSVMSPSMGVRG